ncbi:MAG: ATP-binding protein, partial [Huintestinicola sp.]
MTQTEIRRKANSIMEERRLSAELEADKREREIYEKLPAVAEARRMLAQTATQLSRAIIQRGSGFKENFEKIRSNNLECGRIIKNVLRENGYPEDYLDVHYRCGECSDTGYTDRGMCQCMKRLISRLSCEELNRAANMPEADFAHFDLSYYRDLNIEGRDCYKIMSKNLDFCIRYAESFGKNSKSILLLGKTGVGKTHLSMAIAKEAASAGFDVIYGSVVNFLRKIENEHFGRTSSEEKDGDTLELLCSCDLLVLDDLGAEHHTPFYESTLYNIINTRINTGRSVIISANLSLNELQSRYNERIISRIAGCYEMLYCVGKDIRQLKRL